MDRGGGGGGTGLVGREAGVEGAGVKVAGNMGRWGRGDWREWGMDFL